MSLRYGRKKRYYRGKKTAKKIAYRALKTAYRAKRQLKGELYYKDVVGSVSVSPTTNVQHLCPLIQGLTNADRTGDRVIARSLMLRYELKNNPNAPEVRTRIMVVAYAQDRRLVPSLTAGGDYSILEANNTLSPLSYKNRKNLKILHDESYTGSPDSTTQWIRKIHIKLGHIINFTDATDSSYSKGHIWLVAMSNNGTNMPVLDYYSRLRYTEQ